MKKLRSSAPRGSIFESVENIKVPQSRHDLSYTNHLSCEMGYIYPFYVEETSPGQIMNCKAGIFGRMMPMVSPIMQDINVEMRYFYVPYRLIWENFEDYATGVGEHDWPGMVWDGADLGFQVGTLADYLGIDVENLNHGTYYKAIVDAMPFRAYAKIWNEFFRDQNLQEEFDVCEDKDGVEGFAGDEISLMKCAWRKDYFTSALPWTQRGKMAQFVGDVFLKPNSSYPRFLDDNLTPPRSNLQKGLSTNKEGKFIGNDELTGYPVIGNNLVDILSGLPIANNVEDLNFRIDPNGTLAVAFDLQSLRMANAVQKFFERSARVGNRYCEYILGMYGVNVGDYKLQRPIYLGGGVMPWNILEVMQNEQAQLDSFGDPYDGSTPQGNLAGIGKINGVFGMNKPFYCPEDGLIMGLMYIRPKANYVSGTRKQMIVGVQDSKENNIFKDRFERLYNPYFEHLGEEAVFTYELASTAAAIDAYGAHLAGADSLNIAVFGYQSRYAYRKYRGNEVHGDFRTSLLYWHLGRKYTTAPELNASFVECNPSTRIFAVEEGTNHFLFDVYNKVDAVLPMSQYSIPAL